MSNPFELDQHAISIARQVVGSVSADPIYRTELLVAGYLFMVDSRVTMSDVPVYPSPAELLDYLNTAGQDSGQ